jgi:arginyl-tRNA synthetase
VSRTFGVDDKYLAKIKAKWEYNAISDDAEADETWELIYELSRFGEIYKQVFESIELSILAGWVYNIAQIFNSYYHKYNILKESDIKIRDARLGVVMIYLEIIGCAVQVLGLPIPEKM